MTTTRHVFREHDTMPTGIRCSVIRGLLEEWYLLHQNPSTTRIVTRWAHTEGALAGYTRPGDIVDAVDAGTHADKDRILLALINLFQTGHQLAGRILLQCFLPRLSTMVLTRYAMRTGDRRSWDADGRALIIAEFWEVLTSYPTHRTTKIPARLVLDTMHRVTRTKAYTGDVEIPCAPTELLGETSGHGHNSVAGILYTRQASERDASTTAPTAGELSADSDLLTVLHWAYTTHVITKADAQLLSDFYLPQKPRRTPTPQQHPDATAAGPSSAALRQRRARIVRKLVNAVRNELDLSANQHLDEATAAVA